MLVEFEDGTTIEVPLDRNTGYNAKHIELTANDLPTLNKWLYENKLECNMQQLAGRLHRIRANDVK